MPSALKMQRDVKIGLKSSSLDAGERAFAFARASGIIGKSFVGKRLSALGKISSFAELDRLIFLGARDDLPGRELLLDLERRILHRTVRHMIAVISSYVTPPELLVRLLRSCEYADLKAFLRHIVAGKADPPAFIDIGRFRTVQFEAYPNLAAMLAGTEFDFLLEKDFDALRTADYDITPLEAELDQRYYTLLIQSLSRLNPDDRHFAEMIIAEEISLRNCVWALRLRSYFNKTPEETAEYLMDITMPQGNSLYGPELIPGDIHPRMRASAFFDNTSGKNISLATEARESLRFSLDFRQDWKGWRWESLLGPDLPGGNWQANPRYFQNAASRYIYRLALRCFRRAPFSVSSNFCFIKIKQFEENILTSITEGLALGMDGADVFELLEKSQ